MTRDPMSFLCIGGPLDGKYVAWTDHTEYMFEARDTDNGGDWSDWVDEAKPIPRRVRYKTTKYYRRGWQLDDTGIHYLWVVEGMPATHVWALLLNAYATRISQETTP